MGEIKSLEVPLECPICRSAPQIENRPATAISWVGVSIVHCCDLSIGADDEIAAISHWNTLCLGYRRALAAIPASDARAEALKEAAAVAAKFDSDGMYGAAAIHDAILALAPTTTTR